METNVDWWQVESDCQLWKVAREWAAIFRTVVSNNRRIPTTTHKQWGGIVRICMNNVCAFENGKDRSRDFRELGRWAGMTFAGKMQAKITFLKVYCLVNNVYGLLSTSVKQRIYINKHLNQHTANHPDYIQPIANTPHKLFGYDLKATVLKLKAAGH